MSFENPEFRSDESECNAALNSYKRQVRESRRQGAFQCFCLIAASAGIIFCTATVWDALQHSGQLWALGLMAVSFFVMLYVVGTIGRTTQIIWPQQFADVSRFLDRKRSQTPDINRRSTEYRS
jgi:hypothetical protein